MFFLNYSKASVSFLQKFLFFFLPLFFFAKPYLKNYSCVDIVKFNKDISKNSKTKPSPEKNFFSLKIFYNDWLIFYKVLSSSIPYLVIFKFVIPLFLAIFFIDSRNLISWKYVLLILFKLLPFFISNIQFKNIIYFIWYCREMMF